VSSEYLEQVSRAYGDFFFHYEDTPLLMVNTSDIDLADEGDLDALLRESRRHRRGRLHFSLAHGN
jgi:deoxyadenosine/deoxycytidine kinase